MTTETTDPTAHYSADDWANLYKAEEAKGTRANTHLMAYAMERAEAVADPKAAAMKAAFQATQAPAATAPVDKMPNMTAYLAKCKARCAKHSGQ